MNLLLRALDVRSVLMCTDDRPERANAPQAQSRYTLMTLR
jgi:hypothetical protein